MVMQGRFLATGNGTTSAADPKTSSSNRQQFKETHVHPSIRRYIDMIGVGIPSRRKRSRQGLWEDLDEGRRTNTTSPPPPFGAEGGQHRVVVIGSVSTTQDSLPTNQERIPEVALAGRSNVGKSTLLNALLYGNRARRRRPHDKNDTDTDDDNPLIRKFVRGGTPEHLKLPKGIKAKVSSKPGETQKITFYQLAHTATSEDETCKLRLVDLPGFGFSFTPKKHDGFQELILQYLLERGKPLLQRVLLLLDARHGLKKADLEFLETLQEEARKNPTKRKMPPIQIVLTKCDLVQRDDLARRVVQVRRGLSDVLRRETSALPVLLVSARAGVGFNNIRPRGGHVTRARGGVLELQKELAALVPETNKKKLRHTGSKRPAAGKRRKPTKRLK
ncbi:GTP-binding protein EngB [Seminavis robusta]|uniref:GTP-binding protein EngB n=1 Tax=Seminavis robusta TaxID=568900 RepID=A0A9N8H797_9STRA|nr:GTP-binding protein EngB [Seminavis robusta]|eukprot:Sro171_g075790.1 GTP-binding protein EngB (389) ;mRNA; r:50837-52130